MIYLEAAAPQEVQIDPREVLRYAGFGRNVPEPQMARMIESVTHEIAQAAVCRACFALCDISVTEPLIDFGAFSVMSKALAKNLKGCRRAVLFGATIGAGADRVIAKYNRLSPSAAVIAQAAGAAAIESWCDLFCGRLADRLAKDGCYLRPRFSPGYGDFALECQRDVFRVLDCPRQIGLALTDSCMMTPSKSVSAVMGLSRENTRCDKSGCESCGRRAVCEYARG